MALHTNRGIFLALGGWAKFHHDFQPSSMEFPYHHKVIEREKRIQDQISSMVGHRRKGCSIDSEDYQHRMDQVGPWKDRFIKLSPVGALW